MQAEKQRTALPTGLIQASVRSLPQAGDFIPKGSDEPTFRIGETDAGHSLVVRGHGLRRAAEQERRMLKVALR